MLLSALILAPLCVTWGAVAVFLATAAVQGPARAR